MGWVADPFSRGSSQPRDWTQVSGTAGKFFTSWTTRGARFIYFMYLLLAVLCLHCCAWASYSCSKQGLLFVVVCDKLSIYFVMYFTNNLGRKMLISCCSQKCGGLERGWLAHPGPQSWQVREPGSASKADFKVLHTYVFSQLLVLPWGF